MNRSLRACAPWPSAALIRLGFTLGFIMTCHTTSHGAEGARLLRTVGPGAEDLAVIHLQGKKPALVTATATRKLGRNDKPGGSLEVHRLDGAAAFTPVASGPPQPWNPLGLHVVPKSQAPGFQGKQLLYVSGITCHARVEVFEVLDDGQLKHCTTLAPLPLSQGKGFNSLVATRDGTVYGSVFHLLPQKRNVVSTHIPAGEAQTPADNVILRFTPTGSHGEGRWDKVAQGLNGANGLALSADEKWLLCSNYYNKAVLAFPRVASTGALNAPSVALSKLPFYPDNIKTLPDGSFCVAGQRSVVASFFHLCLGGRTPCRGAAYSFTWDGKAGHKTHDWTDVMKADTGLPSTFLPLGPKGYIGHTRRPGIIEVPLDCGCSAR